MVKNILKIEKNPRCLISFLHIPVLCLYILESANFFDVLKFISKHQRMILKHFFLTYLTF